MSSLVKTTPWTRPQIAARMLAEVADQRRRIGERIAALREESRLTQDEVAHAAGVAPRTYVRWEHGEAFPYWRNFEKLAGAFTKALERPVSVEDILGEIPAVIPDLSEAPDMTQELLDEIRALNARFDRLLDALETQDATPPPDDLARPQEDDRSTQGTADAPDSGQAEDERRSA